MGGTSDEDLSNEEAMFLANRVEREYEENQTFGISPRDAYLLARVCKNQVALIERWPRDWDENGVYVLSGKYNTIKERLNSLVIRNEELERERMRLERELEIARQTLDVFQNQGHLVG